MRCQEFATQELRGQLRRDVGDESLVVEMKRESDASTNDPERALGELIVATDCSALGGTSQRCIVGSGSHPEDAARAVAADAPRRNHLQHRFARGDRDPPRLGSL